MATDELSGEQPATVARPSPLAMRGVSIAVLFGSVGLFVLHEGEELFVPLLLSVLLAYVLEPPVALLMRARLPRLAAAVLVFVIAGAALGAGARSAREQVVAFLDDVPETIATIKRLGDHKPSAPKRGLLQRLQNE